jgi:hypothetical protein
MSLMQAHIAKALAWKPNLDRVLSWRPKFLRRRPRPPVLKTYTDLRTPYRRLLWFAFPLILFFFCLTYGFFFALTAPYLIVPFSTPIVALMLLSIWALPDRAHAPTKSMEFFFCSLVISLILWPNYLALALPGLPWITMLRLTGFPMVFMLLICLSTSPTFRRELYETITAVPWLWPCFIAFIVMHFITIPFNNSPPAAFQRALLQQVNWTAMFLVGAWVCRTPGRVTRLIALLLFMAVPIMLVSVLEAREKAVLWAGHVPSFLKVDDPVAALILSATTRSATGLYRVKATFSTPLGLAEYLALMTPFALFLAMTAKRFSLRIFGLLMLPALFYCIRLTDARLGVVGFGVSLLLYFLFWGLQRLMRDRRDLFAAAVVYAYPAIFCAFAGAVMSVRPLYRMVFGDGAQAASNEARKNQLRMGLPKIAQNPIGHGPGGSGDAMGYGAGEFITVDNYYLTLGLDYGVIGFASFLAIFLLAATHAAYGGVRSVNPRDKEIVLAIPIAIALTAFLVIKIVFSQPDNHPFIYMLLGAAVALVYRSRIEAAAASAEAQATTVHSRGSLVNRPRLAAKTALAQRTDRTAEWR